MGIQFLPLPDDDLRTDCLELMATSEDIVVASIDEEGIPQIRVMFNLRNCNQFPSLVSLYEGHEDDLLVYLGTNTSSAKITQIQSRPAISVLFSDTPKFHSLMVSGNAEIVKDPALKKAIWQKGWEMYYPGGIEDPDYTILRLRPFKAKGWWAGRAIAFSLPVHR